MLPVVLGVVTAVTLVAGVVLIVRNLESRSSGDDPEAAVTLEPIEFVQEDDFFGNLDLGLGSDQAAETIELLGANISSLPDLADLSAGPGGYSATGDDPGLYGGSRQDGVCDVAQLVEFLTDPAFADKAAAWAGALGIDPAEITTYVGSLTPVRLRLDTHVTNHRFVDGQAVPFQSVLQAGTAVLVDETGLPVVKCNCGNPLGPPEDLTELVDEAPDDEGGGDVDLTSLAHNPEDAWEDLDPAAVVTVAEAPERLETLTLVDLDTHDELQRPVGTQGAEDHAPGEVSCEGAGQDVDESPCGPEPDLVLDLLCPEEYPGDFDARPGLDLWSDDWCGGTRTADVDGNGVLDYVGLYYDPYESGSAGYGPPNVLAVLNNDHLTEDDPVVRTTAPIDPFGDQGRAGGPRGEWRGVRDVSGNGADELFLSYELVESALIGALVWDQADEEFGPPPGDFPELRLVGLSGIQSGFYCETVGDRYLLVLWSGQGLFSDEEPSTFVEVVYEYDRSAEAWREAGERSGDLTYEELLDLEQCP